MSDEAVCISLWANVSKIGVNPFPAMGKIVEHTRFISFDQATSLGERKLWIQTSLCYSLLVVKGLDEYIHSNFVFWSTDIIIFFFFFLNTF